MRIVKLSDLSEEDKKRIQERQIQNLRTNRQNRIEANKKFNELINQKGEFDTSRHTSTVGRLQKAYKNNETVKKSLDGYYKNNTTSLWKGTQNFADATGKIGENTYKGAENGILSSIQNLGRNMFNLQGRKEEENIFDKVNKQILDSRKDLSPEERTSIIDKMNNSSFSQKNLIKGIEEKNQKFQEKKNENTLKIQQNTDSISNPVGKYIAGEIAPGIGQMLPGMLPGIGTTYFISSATGNYHDDAIQRGMTEDQATIYSGTMGIIEGALESLGANLTKNVGKQLLKKNIKGALVNYGLDIGENFLEESIVEPISEIAAQVYGVKDKADWSDVWQRAIESGVAGALTSAITGGVSGVIGGIGSKVTQQNQYVDYNTNKKLNKDSQNWLKQAENIIQENSTPKLSPQLAQNQQNTAAQQITPTIQNNVQNGISEQTNGMLNNKEVPMLNYQYEKSDNVKINNLRQDANKYFNNSEKARNYVSMLERIITDKNIDIRLDADLKTPDGKIANGSYSNGVITVNPNSTRAGEFIAVHELTHAIGTDSMRNIIETYRKSDPEFNIAVEKLLQNYNSTEITDEALSDVSAQLFGNQEFINNVAQTNPNIFKKIYSEIKYLWHQFRGYKNQDQFIEDLYYKWTQAYNSSNKLNETSNYYIEPIANFNETEYNNIIEEKLTKKEYAILRSIINSDSNIKPGINYIEVTNGRYTVYYKGFDDFKVMSRKVDTDAGRINKRNDTTGRKTRYSKTFEQSFGNERTTTSNDEISNINTQGTRERSGSDTSSSTNIENVKYSIQESENNSGSFSFDKNARRYEDLEIANTVKFNKKADGTINIEISDNNELINQFTVFSKESASKQLGNNIADYIYNNATEDSKVINLKQKENVEFQDTSNKAKQLEIIKKTNPMLDDYHVGIRNIDDIKTFDEVINDEESFAWGDFTKKDAERALKKGKITIYSSYPIEQGTFVSTSKIQAEQYAGGKGRKMYSKTVSLEEVAWINGDEGQYANINQKYSLETDKWNNYLDDNFKSEGTKTNLKDIKNIAPIAKDVKNNAPIKNVPNMQVQQEKVKAPVKDINVKQYYKYKKNILNARETEINNLIKNKNETINELEKKIVEKENLLNSKKDKTTRTANKLKMQIENLKQRKSKIENEYLGRIDRKTAKVTKDQISLSAKEKMGITRHDIIQKNREIARKNIENISTWKDKNNGLKYQLETMERNMYDIIPDKAEVKQMIDTYFEPIHKSEADKQKFINKYNDKIKGLRLNKYESEAVQLLGEQKYNPSFRVEDVQNILNRVNDNINKNKIDKSKVDIAIETFRSIYDELFELENKALIENGYQEKPYRKGYFPHFIDYIPETKTEKVLNMLGFKIDKRPLPTNIAGITEQFVPGKTWNKSALERKTDKTDYNALKGFDTYIAQAADNIFHTENIQRLRGLENEIRYQYSDEGIKERIDNILNDDSLYQEEKQDLIDGIFKQVENPMPNLVTELRRYTNALANKKSEADRSIENKIGRPIYSTVNAIENRFGANAVGLNIGSAITNFIPITQAYSQVSSKNMSRAMIDTVKSYVNDDGFINKSAFLTNRLNQSEKLYKTTIEKISDKTNFLFNGIDEVTSNIVVRGKYLENIENGMTEIDAMKDADNFARKVIGDRSKGSLPTIFEEKNPVTKMFTQFQLEVNNQFRYMFKDLPRDLAEKGLGAIALAFFKMFIVAWLYNEASEKITGRKPAFSPIDLAISAYKNITNKDKKTYEKIVNISTEVGEQLPFVGGLLGGGRVPVNGAIPGVGNLTKGTVGLITGEIDSKKAVNTIGKELAKPLYYLLPPFGGAQLKKSIEGIKTVTDGGSYGIDNKGNKTLQFPVENQTAKEYIKAGLFGKYVSPLAKTYTENGYTSLNAKDTKTYEDSKLTYKEYLEYKGADLKTNKDKIKYIESKNMTTEQKWGIYKNDVFSTTERKEDGGSQLKDAEYITSDGVSKSDYINIYNKAQQSNIDMPTIDEYKKMKTNNISLNNYMDYKVKIKQMEENKRKRKELSETENLKNTDKIQILLDSNYSDKTISGIYANYIKNKKDTEYDIIKAAGINIKEYLKYKQQEFKSDKYDDGTLTGKTVSNSKQQKFVKYVNSMNIEGNQRLLLYAMQGYNMNTFQKAKVASYVKELKLDKDTKLKLYDKFDGFTVYKDGTIKY